MTRFPLDNQYNALSVEYAGVEVGGGIYYKRKGSFSSFFGALSLTQWLRYQGFLVSRQHQLVGRGSSDVCELRGFSDITFQRFLPVQPWASSPVSLSSIPVVSFFVSLSGTCCVCGFLQHSPCLPQLHCQRAEPILCRSLDPSLGWKTDDPG